MTIAEGSTESRRFVATFERDGAIGMDSPRRMIHYAELIDEQWPANPAALSGVA